MDELIAQGTALNTGDRPLHDEIVRRVFSEQAQAIRDNSRRELRRGVILGVSGSVFVGDLIYVIARFIAS